MLSAIILATLLLPALAYVYGTAQEDLLCTDSYTEFEGASVSSNINGTSIRNRLYEVFYAPNKHLPYSVLVTYQLLFANGTRMNLITNPTCNTEWWKWHSSPVFLLVDSSTLNLYLLNALNYLEDWTPPSVTITTTIRPCPDKTNNFLSEMTASVSLHVRDMILQAQSIVHEI